MIARRHRPEQREIVRPAVPWTVTIAFGTREVVHKSVASSWAVALDLATRAVRRDGIAPLDAVPTSIAVRPG